MRSTTEEGQKTFQELERGVITEYDLLAKASPTHPLLGMLTREGETFRFNRMFDVQYNGSNVRDRYEALTLDLREAREGLN